MPLSAMGFLQFMAPTIGFFTGVLQGEEFRALHGVSFGFIWAAAAVFIFGAVRTARAARLAAAQGPVAEAQT
jgi:chloramphenicol-sensitive protein RarD